MSVKGATSTTNPPADHIPHEKIAMRAYEKWLKRGCPKGSEKQDWHEAECELQEEKKRGTPVRR
jgi:hypothetical protein